MNQDAAKTLGGAVGYLIGVLLVVALFIWFLPWVTIHSINGIFDTSIEHSAINYFYVWILYLFWRNLGGLNLRDSK